MFAPNPGLDYAAVRDSDNSCGVIAVQFKTYAGGGSYNYTLRRQLDPTGGQIYYTNYLSGTAYTWRGCSYDNVGSYTLYCEQADTTWQFSDWSNKLSFTVFN